MSHAPRRHRFPVLVATTAMVASLLPVTMLPASAATASARTIDDACPAGRVPSAGFRDVSGSIFELEINCVAWYSIASGRSDGTYGPGADVSRGAMAAFLARLIESAGKVLDPTPPQAFDDVAGHTFELQINQLASLGVVGGSPDSADYDRDGDTTELIFKPNTPVKREQMASFLNGAHGAITDVRVSSADDFFTDDEGNVHEGNINAMASVGVASGVSSTRFGVGRTVTRGSMAAFLARELDYLVELGYLSPPVQGVADVVLDSKKINQGRQAIGRIFTKDNVPVRSATVDICGGEFGKAVSMNVDNFAFSFTIPFQAKIGACRLDFDIVLGNNQRETEAQVIEVLKTNKTLLGPELVTVGPLTVGSEFVTIRYEFIAASDLNDAVEASKFRLYGFAGQQFPAVSAARVGQYSVEAQFPRSQYDSATTGGIAQFAVQDQNGYQVAESSFGIKDVRLNPGETEFPDLLSAIANGNAVTYTFDAPVFEVAPADFAAVYSSNGAASTVTGGAIASGGPGGNSFTVTFTPPEGGGVILRGVIKANSIASSAGGPQANGRQTEDVPGPSQSSSPHLTSMILDQANNQVQFIYSEAVVNKAAAGASPSPLCLMDPLVTGCGGSPGTGYQIYDITGKTYSSTSAVQGSNNTIIVQFAAGQVTGLIQGGSADQGAVQASRNAALFNGVDEIGRQNTFEAGHTAAPDLLKVSKVTDANGNLRVTYTFDQSAVLTTGNPIGDFLVYGQDNSRKVLTRTTCKAEGVTVYCTLPAASADFQFASTAVYGAVSYAAVNAGGNSKYNPEGGFVFTS